MSLPLPSWSSAGPSANHTPSAWSAASSPASSAALSSASSAERVSPPARSGNVPTVVITAPTAATATAATAERVSPPARFGNVPAVTITAPTAATATALTPPSTPPSAAALMHSTDKQHYTNAVTAMLNSAALITTVGGLQQFLSSIPLNSGLYLDLEGYRLGRAGEISLITVLVWPLAVVRIIDVQVLGPAAFTTATSEGVTLKSLLEDVRYGKFLWDLRSDYDALFHLHWIKPQGIVDIQLLENYSRPGDRRRLGALARAVNDVAPLTNVEAARFRLCKQGTKRAMSMNTNVFANRPLSSTMLRYCANDVVHLPFLHRYYFDRCQENGWYPEAVPRETVARAVHACSADYVAGSRDLQYGPWDTELNQ